MSTLTDRYELQAVLRDTASTRVQRGHARIADIPVIVQQIAKHDRPPEEMRGLIERAGRALAEAGLPGRLVESGETAETVWAAFEAHGEPIAMALRRGRDDELMAAVAADGARALVALEKVGLAHGAIEPRTLFHANERVTLIGFEGLHELGVSYTGRGDRDLRFAAPETHGTAKGDIRSDVYALGCVLYALLAGSPPFLGLDPEHLRSLHREAAVPELPGVDPLWNQLIASMLAKDPSARPSPSALLEKIRKMRTRSFAATPAPLVAEPVAQPRRRGKGGALVAVVVLGALAVGVGAALAGRLDDAIGPAAGATVVPASSGPLIASTPAPGTAAPTAVGPKPTPTVQPTVARTVAPTVAPATAPPATARPVTPAPTAAPPAVALAQVMPASGAAGSTFLFRFLEMPPGQPYQTSLITPRGDQPQYVGTGAVPGNGIVLVSLDTGSAWTRGGYAMRIVAGGVMRSIVFTVN